AEDGIRDDLVTGVQTCALPISRLYVWTTFNSPQAQPPAFDSVSRFRDAFRQFTDERIARVFSQLRSMDGVISTDIEEMALDEWRSEERRVGEGCRSGEEGSHGR